MHYLFSIGVLGLCAALAAAQETTSYDPLRGSASAKIALLDLVIDDSERKRELPVLIYLPAGDQPAPVVLFSHGLGGTRKGSAFLGKHWAGRGYVAVFLQHPGSDDSVWKDTPILRRMAAMRNAASAENFSLRCGDVKKALDQLETWNRDPTHRLHARMDLEHVGMSGHSFGAVTTQAVSGQAYPIVGQRFLDKRIDAAISLSPSTPARRSASAAFGSVSLPWMLMTGTHDASPIGNQTIESRREVYPNLPATIDKYELVLDGAEHSAFTERKLPGDKQPRNPKHHQAIKAMSTAFWDAYLRQDPQAKAWLNGEQAANVLEPKDVWRHAQGKAK